MPDPVSRRGFLRSAAAMTLGTVVPATAPAQEAGAVLPIRKGVLLDMLPQNLTYRERFKLARDVGFEAIQAPTTPDPHQAEAIQRAASEAGITIDSVMNMAHWEYPLSSPDPAVVEKSIEGMKTSLHNAKLWGAKAVLLVPAVVNEQTGYRAAWTRSQQQIRRLLPLAEELQVIIAIEEVWNKFLLSPLEFATYVDEFNSPWLKAWFDIGNVVLYGYPQDWIRTLGQRIVELHVKDFRRQGYAWVNLGEGDVNWPEVRRALREIGYQGTATVELEGGGEAYLRDVSRRVDRLLLGKA